MLPRIFCSNFLSEPTPKNDSNCLFNTTNWYLSSRLKVTNWISMIILIICEVQWVIGSTIFFLQSETTSQKHTNIKLTATNVIHNTSSMLVLLCVSDDEFRKTYLPKEIYLWQYYTSLFLLSVMVWIIDVSTVAGFNAEFKLSVNT